MLNAPFAGLMKKFTRVEGINMRLASDVKRGWGKPLSRPAPKLVSDLDMSFEDFKHLFALKTAGEKQREGDVQKIMIGYFEKQSPDVYKVAQLMMARVFFMEVP
jgi:hypothetical protein